MVQIFLTVLAAILANAEDSKPKDAQPSNYCGIVALHRAFSHAGIEVEFSTLIDARYLSTERGSSAGDLVTACGDFGVNCSAMEHMTCGMLAYLQIPAILHVRSLLSSDEYDHWVLFLGLEDGGAVIYDGVSGRQVVDFDEISSRWDGNAILVGRDEGAANMVLPVVSGLLPWLAALGLLSLTVFAVEYFQIESMVLGRRFSFAIVALLVLAGAIVANRAYIALSPQKGLRNAKAISAIREVRASYFYDHLSYEEFAQMRQMPSSVVIDARSEVDFLRGHIPNAVNVPPSLAAPDIRKRILLKVARSSSQNPVFLIYCQSQQCPYSGIVAERISNEFSGKPYILKGGWVEWLANDGERSAEEL